MVDMLNKQYYRAPPFCQVLCLLFCLFYLYFFCFIHVANMYGWCDPFHFTVEKTERPEGTKELGQKDTSHNYRARVTQVCLPPKRVLTPTLPNRLLTHRVRIWQKINCIFNITSPIPSKEPKNLIK